MENNVNKKFITTRKMFLISAVVAVLSCTATYFVAEKHFETKSEKTDNKNTNI